MNSLSRFTISSTSEREHERALVTIEDRSERSIARLQAAGREAYVAMGQATLLDRARNEWALLSPSASGALELLFTTGVMRMAAELQAPVRR